MASKKKQKQVPVPVVTAPPVAQPITNDVLEDVVAEIFNIGRSAQLQLVIGIGEVILRKFCGGSFAAYQARGPKDASLRKLSDKLVAGGLTDMSAPYLQRAVGIYELSTRLPVSTWIHLTASHYRAILNLPQEKQQKLLTKANAHQLSVERLTREADGARKAASDGRGRPRLPTFVKTINAFERYLAEGSGAFDELDQVGELDEDEANRLYQAVTGMKAKCEALQEALAVRTTGFGASRAKE